MNLFLTVEYKLVARAVVALLALNRSLCLLVLASSLRPRCLIDDGGYFRYANYLGDDDDDDDDDCCRSSAYHCDLSWQFDDHFYY